MLPLVEDMPSKGASEGGITIVEFSDFQCPYCARAAQTIQDVVDKYAEDVRLVYVQFPLESIHPWARSASIASLCAADQSIDAFWTLHDKYFENQGELDSTNVIERSQDYLSDTGLDISSWTACASDADSEAFKNASARVDAALELGMEHGVNSTPGFFVNGRFVSGAQPAETFEELIEQARGQ
jgi:protein-disulfide isomerase